MTPETVPTVASGAITAAGPLEHRCPFVDEADHGRVVLTWRTAGSTIELHSLRAYLDQFRDEEVSHEDLTDRIAADAAALNGITDVQAVTMWVTAGLEVTCATTATPPRPPSP